MPICAASRSSRIARSLAVTAGLREMTRSMMRWSCNGPSEDACEESHRAQATRAAGLISELYSGSASLPPRSGGAVLEDDAAPREVLSDPVGLGEVPLLARGIAGRDLRLDLGRQDLVGRGQNPEHPVRLTQGRR